MNNQIYISVYPKLLCAVTRIFPAGMGLREGSFIVLLGAYGVGEDSAFAYSLLVFAVTPISPGFLGGLIESRKIFN